MTELSLELFLGIFLPVTFFLFGFIINQLRSIEKTTENTGMIIGIAYKDTIIDYYREIRRNQVPSGGDGAPPPLPSSRVSEKDILLGKLKDGTITPDESRRLHAILEQEAANARATGTLGALLAILGLLALLALLSDSR